MGLWAVDLVLAVEFFGSSDFSVLNKGASVGILLLRSY
jgi:hypothetical protein